MHDIFTGYGIDFDSYFVAILIPSPITNNHYESSLLVPCCTAARLGAMIHSLSSPGPRNTMGSGSGVKHKLGAGNSAETLNEFVFIYLCVLFTRIFNCRTRGQESQLSCFDVCRVPRPGPVDDKFICLIPTSHAIQHQRRPQTFALLTRRASSNLVIFFLYSVQEIIFSCSFTYIIGGPRVPEFHVKTPTSPQNQSKNDHLGQ